MKKAIAMKCSQKDWDSIKGRITLPITDVDFEFKYSTYLTNCFHGSYGIGSFRAGFAKGNIEEIHETFNAKIFLEACGIETDVYEITKEQVNYYYKNCNSVGQVQLMREFPDAFKKELEVGKWYKAVYSNINYLFLVTKKSDGFYIGCGIVDDVKWNDELSFSITYDYKFQETTPQEVEAALICEAKKRGYSNTNGFYQYSSDTNRLYLFTSYGTNPRIVFDNGLWSDVVEKMTLEQIEKELGRKIELI